jgi:hypothetical protein
VVVHAEPPIEGDGVLKCLDLGGIDFDRRHQDTFPGAMDSVFIASIVIVDHPSLLSALYRRCQHIIMR